VDRWPALAGWRGLHDPEVQAHFNHTFYAYDAALGNDAAMIKNGLKLDYTIGYFGAVADGCIKARLEQALPTLFMLWSPHHLLPQFKLSRIQLWPFQSDAEFRDGKTDYPIDIVEKVVSKSLAQIAPEVSKLVARYMISNPNQEEIMAAVDRDNFTAHGASCAWLLNAKNAAKMRSWLPPPEVRRSLLSHPYCGSCARVAVGGRLGMVGLLPEQAFGCASGQYLAAADDDRCSVCPPGSSSVGGRASMCTQCRPGRSASAAQPLLGAVFSFGSG
jgi:hypothetical protein